MKKVFCMLAPAIIFCFSLKGQDKNVVQLSGHVMNDTLRGIPFAHVYVKKLSRGAICDFWGYFNFAAESGDTIVISSLGYKRKVVVLPDTFPSHNYSLRIKLDRDTITLPEATIFPWKTFEQFKVVFVNAEIHDDDYDRAEKNFAMLKKHKLYDDMILDASLNYKYLMQERYDKLYYAGQTRPLSIFNVMSWAQFFKAIRDGEFNTRDQETDNRNEPDDYYRD